MEATERFFDQRASPGEAASGQLSEADIEAARVRLRTLEGATVRSAARAAMRRTPTGPPPTVTRVNEAVQELCAEEIEQISAMGFESGMAAYALVATHAPIAEAVPIAIEWILGHDAIAATNPHQFANIVRFLAIRTHAELHAVDEALRTAEYNAEQASHALLRSHRARAGGNDDDGDSEGNDDDAYGVSNLRGVDRSTLSRVLTDPQIIMGLTDPNTVSIFEAVILQRLSEEDLQQALRNPTVGPVLQRLVQLVGRPDSDDDSG